MSPALNPFSVPVELWLVLVHGTRAHLRDQDLLMLQEHCLCAILLLLGRVVRDTSLPAELQRAGLVLAVIFQLASLLGLLACLFPAPSPSRGLGWPVILLSSHAGCQGHRPGGEAAARHCCEPERHLIGPFFQGAPWQVAQDSCWPPRPVTPMCRAVPMT